MNEKTGVRLPLSALADDALGQSNVLIQHLSTIDAMATAQNEDAGIFHLVTFHLMMEEYGIDIGTVREIIRAEDITPVPGAPTHVRGVINLRGKIIPVVDLRKRLGLHGTGSAETLRIIVVELGEKLVGMLVDRVSQVIKVPAGMVEEIPEEATCGEENYIMGVGKQNGRLIIMLDLNRSLLLC